MTAAPQRKAINAHSIGVALSQFAPKREPHPYRAPFSCWAEVKRCFTGSY